MHFHFFLFFFFVQFISPGNFFFNILSLSTNTSVSWIRKPQKQQHFLYIFSSLLLGSKADRTKISAFVCLLLSHFVIIGRKQMFFMLCLSVKWKIKQAAGQPLLTASPSIKFYDWVIHNYSQCNFRLPNSSPLIFCLLIYQAKLTYGKRLQIYGAHSEAQTHYLTFIPWWHVPVYIWYPQCDHFMKKILSQLIINAWCLQPYHTE